MSISASAFLAGGCSETPATAGPGARKTGAGESASSMETQAVAAVAELSSEELELVQELSQTDRQVRAHEQAHLAAAGAYATGGASYQYVTGPDNQRYAVAGEVGIDTSPVPGDPEATIQKARVVQAAAMAPAEPSGQDRQVAASAASMEQKARQELAELQRLQHAAAQYQQNGQTAPEPDTQSDPILSLIA